MSLRDLRRHVGRLALVGFSGRSVPDDLRRIAGAFDLAGVTCSARNIEEPEQLVELAREAAGLAADWPFWIGADAPLAAANWPPLITLGRCGDDELARRFGEAMAAELRGAGINLAFAPSLDLPSRTGGGNSLDETPAHAARLARILISALQQNGIAACGGHFPGCGDVPAGDARPMLEHDLSRLKAVEWTTFRAAIEESVAMIAIGHVYVPAIDEDRPAALSPKIVGLLRTALGYDGLAVADDLGAMALTAEREMPDAAVEALAAGCDLVRLPDATPDQQCGVFERIIHAVEAGELRLTRVEDAMARQRLAKERFASVTSRPLTSAPVGAVAHQAIAREMRRWL